MQILTRDSVKTEKSFLRFAELGPGLDHCLVPCRQRQGSADVCCGQKPGDRVWAWVERADKDSGAPISAGPQATLRPSPEPPLCPVPSVGAVLRNKPDRF